MKPHRRPENENLKNALRDASEEILAAEWASCGQSEPDPALRERVLAQVRRQKMRSLKKSRPFMRFAQTAAMLVLTVGVILFCIPSVRAALVNAVITWYDEYFSVEFNPDLEKDGQLPEGIVWKTDVAALPDGFTLVEQKVSSISVWTLYQNEDGEYLILTGSTDGADMMYDTGFQVENTVVGEYSGYYMHHSEDSMTLITWSEGRAVYTLMTYSPDITMEMLIEMGESLQ